MTQNQYPDPMSMNPFESVNPAPASGSRAPDVWNVALRYKFLLIAAVIVGTVCGQLLYMKLGPAYEATTRVLVSKRATPSIRDSDTANLGERTEHITLILSPFIVEEAVKKYNLDQLPSLEGDPDPVDSILDDLRVKRSAGSDRSVLNVLDISYTSRDPGDAEKIVEAIVGSYRDYLAATREQHASESVKLISAASEDLARELKEKEAEYIAFRDASPYFWQGPPGTSGTGDVENLDQQRLLAIEAECRLNLLKRADVNSKIRALEQAIARGDLQQDLEILVRRFLALDGASNPASSDDQTANLREQLLPLIIEYENLRRDFGPNHPDVARVRNTMETLRDFYAKQGVVLPETLNEEAGKDAVAANARAKVDVVALYLTSLKQQLVELGIRDQELAVLREQAGKKLKEYSHFQVEDEAKNDEIKRIKKLYEAVIGRLNEFGIEKDKGGYTLKQIAPIREGLVIKRQIRFLGVGAAFFGALVFAGVYLREIQDKTLKSLEEVRSNCQWPVVGQVPSYTLPTPQEVAQSQSGFDAGLCYYYRPGSTEAESYRNLRTSLYFSAAANGYRVLQVSSAEPGDGKTTLASNLALAIAHSGRRVLLIDCDLRCPKIHKLFGVRQEIGVTDVLAGEIQLINAIRETEVTGLSLLCAGLTPANPSEMLGSPQFQNMLNELRDQFDIVIVDTPPLLAVSDPCVVAASTDGLLLVVRIGKNKRASVLQAQELLKTNHINVLGVVTNCGDAASERDYNYTRPGSEPYGKPAWSGDMQHMVTTVEAPLVTEDHLNP